MPKTSLDKFIRRIERTIHGVVEFRIMHSTHGPDQSFIALIDVMAFRKDPNFKHTRDIRLLDKLPGKKTIFGDSCINYTQHERTHPSLADEKDFDDRPGTFTDDGIVGEGQTATRAYKNLLRRMAGKRILIAVFDKKYTFRAPNDLL